MSLDRILIRMAYWYHRKYLSDPTEDVRVATETLLADFLREIRDVSIVRRQLDEQAKTKTPAESLRRVHADPAQESLPDLTLETSERAVFIGDNDYQSSHDSEIKEDFTSIADDRDAGGTHVLAYLCQCYLTYIS